MSRLPALALALALLPRPACAQVPAPQAAFALDVRGFIEAAEKRDQKTLQSLETLQRRLDACADRACVKAWGATFFPEAKRLTADKTHETVAARLRLLEGEYRVLLAQSAPARDAARKPLAKAAERLGAAKPAAQQGELDRFYSGSADPAVPAVTPVAGWRPATALVANAKTAQRRSPPALPPLKKPKTAAPSPAPSPSLPAVALQGKVPSPADWSEALVRAMFLPPPPPKPKAVKGKRAAAVVSAAPAPEPVAVEYKIDERGQIVKVSLPELGYSDTRDFVNGLIVHDTLKRGEATVQVDNHYDAKGRLIRRTAQGANPDGSALAAAIDFDPATGRPRRGIESGRPEGQVRLSFDRKGNPLNSLLLSPLPLAGAVADFVLDWQISREDRLHIQEDTRPREFNSPFWDGHWRGTSRGWTDPDLPKTWTRHPILGKRLPHEGVDLPMPEGTKVYPARRGKVVAVGWEGGYGQCVRIQHYKNNNPDGAPDEITVYGHLSKILVRRGRWVTPGKDVIGLVGSTGLSTGPHLHFEVREGDGSSVDPMQKLSPTVPNRADKEIPQVASTFQN